MVIYVVQVGDTIASIANKFGVSQTRIILENGITNPMDLVNGQTIVITYPQETYIVKEGDSLAEIALKNGTTIMQLYRNNPYLWESEYIYPGEELVIRYDLKAEIKTNAYAFAFIDKDILRKTLPYLTYISILNYKTLRKGEIESFDDDSDLIETAKQFGVAPLMLLSSLTLQGERNPETVYEILLNADYQDKHAENVLKVLKEKGYYGVNITITFLNETNQELYLNYLKRISSRLNKEGYQVFLTIDPNYMEEDEQIVFEKVDFSQYNDLVADIYVMRFFWGTQYGPPKPVSSMKNISLYVDYLKQMIYPKKIGVGFPLLGYDWTLPYIQGFSQANAIKLDVALELAQSMKSTILFDEASKTPYFEYSIDSSSSLIQHIVWFVDARTFGSITDLVFEDGLGSTGVWNIMSYSSQLWLVINSNFDIQKLLPEMY